MKIELLDHGYVELVETWGSDERIIEAARMSTQKGFEGWGPKTCPTCGEPGHKCPTCKGFGTVAGDEKLLKYLWDHKHGTPFEMAGAILEVQAPIFVFREWHRHRTQSYNEMSARYAPLPDLSYVPSAIRVALGGGHLTKQAGSIAGAAELTDESISWFRGQLGQLYRDAQDLYELALEKGIPKELARLCLPVGRYSRMRASANLRNWLGFLALRMDKAAQWEIRQYAIAVHQILAERFPRTIVLFNETK